MYHHIQPWSQAKAKWQTAFTVDSDTFDAHLAYLKSKGYTTISTSQLAQSLINHSSPPAKSIVITLDDGYQDAYTYALPILQKYQMHADFLIPTGLLNNPDYMSGDQLKAALSTGLISTINHTYSHTNLGAVNQEKISFEVLTAKKQLADIGQNTTIFGYPYGAVTATKFLQENDYIAALSTIQGQTQCDSFIMSLNRTRVGNSQLSAYGI
ncbi:MAG: polysaccharide deacetylase family protein [Candidatus Curtissbacteria bacterium]|nr:polysaccharide deacetylase family protein [Candidatus Curtissbacteria bacterium]